MFLHPAGCRNKKLQWKLKGASRKEQMQAFGKILDVYRDLKFVTVPPVHIRQRSSTKYE